MLEEKDFSKIPSLHSVSVTENRTVVTEEREFHDKPQNYFCSLERDSLGHPPILLYFPALSAKPQCSPCPTNDIAFQTRLIPSLHTGQKIFLFSAQFFPFSAHTKSAASSIDHSIITLLYLISSSSFESNSIPDPINSSGNTLMDCPGSGMLQVPCKNCFCVAPAPLSSPKLFRAEN